MKTKKIILPISTKDSIDLSAIRSTEGLIVGKVNGNVVGVIIEEEDSDPCWTFRTNSWGDISSHYVGESLIDLIQMLLKKYPGITFEFVEEA